jgi:hypothetical protein
MANQILTISMITREALRVLVNNLSFTKGVNRQYDDQFAVKGAKIGSTLNIRKPARYVGRTGPTINIESQTETYVPLTLSTQRGVDVQFTSADLHLSMDDFSDRYLKPAMANVANFIDYDGLQLASGVWNQTGTGGTPPSSLLTYLNANKLLADNAIPQDDMRSAIIGPAAEAAIVNALTTFFNPQRTISEQYEMGKMGRAIGLKWSMDQNVGMHTNGAYSGTPLVNGANQTGSSLITDGWGNNISDLLNVGDIFTVAGVYAVNPQSRQSTGALQQFVVTAQASSGASTGPATISIAPAITPSGQFQNVTASPADDAVITVYGAASLQYATNLVHHRDAFVLGSADLPLPKGVDMAARVADPESGLSVRMVRAYDVVNDLFVTRLDVLYGWALLYPQLACRVAG